MNLEKAIEILTICSKGDPYHPAGDAIDAIKLGIENLKWRQLMKRDYGSWCGPPLPGETEE